MANRFTKRKVTEWARNSIDRLAENHNFDLRNGYAQVDNKAPAGSFESRLLVRNRAYGELMALEALCATFNLMEVDLDSEG